MDGDLPDVLRRAGPLLPDMLEVFSAQQHKLIITYLLDAVSDYPPHTFSLLYEVQFEFLMLMERICEFRLVTLHDVEAVFLGKTRDFCKGLAHVIFFRLSGTNI